MNASTQRFRLGFVVMTVRWNLNADRAQYGGPLHVNKRNDGIRVTGGLHRVGFSLEAAWKRFPEARQPANAPCVSSNGLPGAMYALTSPRESMEPIRSSKALTDPVVGS